MTTYVLTASCYSEDQTVIAHAGEAFARIMIGFGLEGIPINLTVSAYDDDDDDDDTEPAEHEEEGP